MCVARPSVRRRAWRALAGRRPPRRGGSGRALVLGTIETSLPDETAAVGGETPAVNLSRFVRAQAAVHAPLRGGPGMVYDGRELQPPRTTSRTWSRCRVGHEGVGGRASPTRRGCGDAGARARGIAPRGRPGGEGDRPLHGKPLVPRCTNVGGDTSRPLSSPTATSPYPRFAAVVPAGPHEPLRRARRKASTGLLGRTRDDAAGEERSTKGAKLLGLGYPAAGHRQAAEGRTTGRWTFHDRADQDGGRTSPSGGIKTAVLLHVKREGLPPVSDASDVPRACATSWPRSSGPWSPPVVAELVKAAREHRPPQPRPGPGASRRTPSCAARASGQLASWAWPIFIPPPVPDTTTPP